MAGNASRNPAVAPPQPEEIDASCRWPVLYMFGAALVWLTVSLALGVVASIKMHAPGFWADCPYVTFGRVRPAFMSLFLYGFASQAGLGAGLWMLARLGKTTLAYASVTTLGAVLWNAGVTLGLCQLLAGQTTGFQWMEFPRLAAAFLVGGFFMIALTGFLTLRQRGVQYLFVSQWYLVAALFCFPWLMTVGYTVGVVGSFHGVIQAVANAWFTNGILYLWLTPLALAVLYYLLPKVSTKPIHSNQAAAFAFWVLLFAGSWSGLSQLAAGPIPRWMVGAGVAGKVILLVVIGGFAVNWFGTLKSGSKSTIHSSVWPYLFLSAWSFILGLGLDILGTHSSIASTTVFTTYSLGTSHLLLFGFVAMALFAGLQHITERLLDAEWSHAGLLKAHFALSLLGVLLISGAYVFGGFSWGNYLNLGNGPFVEGIRGLVPFLGAATLGFTLFLLGQVLLLFSFVCTCWEATSEMRAEWCASCCGVDTGSSSKKVKARA